jgi:hypothetical protein
MASVLALLRRRADRDAVCRATPRAASLVFCSGVRHLAELLGQRGTDVMCVISDLRDNGGAPAGSALRSTLVWGAPPVVLRTPLTASASRDVVRLASLGINVRLSLNGSDELIAEVSAAMTGDAAPDAQVAILRSMGASVPDFLQPLFLAAAVQGARRCPVTALAAGVGMSVRTAERRLKRAGWPSAHRLLGWSLLAHSIWRMDVLGYTPKQAARSAGFETRGALANLVQRHQRCTLNDLRAVGFDAFFQRFAHELRDRPATGGRPVPLLSEQDTYSRFRTVSEEP